MNRVAKALIYIFLCISFNVSGQDSIKVNLIIPVLNNHKFIPNRIVLDPFNKTSFQLNMGIGSSSRFNLPSVSIGDTLFTPTSGTLVFANLAFRLDLKLKKGVSYMLRAGGSARVGAEPYSLYTNGLNTVSGITNAWKVSLYNNDKHYLSSIFGVSTFDASVTNISEFIDNILSGTDFDGLTKKISVLQGFTGIQYAYAFGPTIGLQTIAAYVYGDLFESGKSGGKLNASAAMDFDLLPKARIPLGISLAVAYITIPEYTAAQYNTTEMYNMKIAYTGSASFIISADATSYTAPYLIGRIAEQNNVETRVYNYGINMIVYFN